MCLVSIVTPSYNSASYIASTIKSVLQQELADFEMIIVDDYSTDGTVEVVKEYTKLDSRIKLIELDCNGGAAVARNTAIEMAKGRYIAFIDSDDLWFPEKLASQIKFMRGNDVAFSYSAYEKVDELGHRLGAVGVPKKVSYNDLLKVCSIGCLTAIYDAEKLGKVYMPLIRRRQDLGLWLRILKKIPYAYATPGVLAQYRVRGGSISSDKRIAAKYTWKLYREIERLSIGKAAYYFSHYAINGIFRTKFPNLARFLGLLK